MPGVSIPMPCPDARGIVAAVTRIISAHGGNLLDTDRIIPNDVVRVSHRCSVDDLKHMGYDLERIVLARTEGGQYSTPIHIPHGALTDFTPADYRQIHHPGTYN